MSRRFEREQREREQREAAARGRGGVSDRMISPTAMPVALEAATLASSRDVVVAPVPVDAVAHPAELEGDDDNVSEGAPEPSKAPEAPAIDPASPDSVRRIANAEALQPPREGHWPLLWRQGRDAAIRAFREGRRNRPTQPPKLGCRQCWRAGRDAALTILDPEGRLR